MTREELAAVGRLMFGEEWQTAMAQALGRGPRRVRWWATGARPVPASVPGELRALAPEVAAGLEARAKALREWAEKGLDGGP